MEKSFCSGLCYIVAVNCLFERSSDPFNPGGMVSCVVANGYSFTGIKKLEFFP